MAISTGKIKKIESLLPRAMAADRLAAQREIKRLNRAKPKVFSEAKLTQRLARLEKRIDASVRRKTLRKDNLPPLLYNDDLPITAKKDEIIRAIAKHRVIIVSGETGSGKTTQLPKFCLAAGRGIDGLIGHTQPRRIAAITVAHRIAEELGQQLGRAVGYKIRFKDRIRKDAYLKLMTDGILLAETQSDPYLKAYDTIIVDEAHERSLNIDFILGILQTLIVQRSDLKLIITSATIDTEKFSKAFNNAPVLEVSGRMYPVEVRYQPQDAVQADNGDLTHVEVAVQAVKQILNQSPWGDVLVFMPTEQDIRDTCELIEAGSPKGACVLSPYQICGRLRTGPNLTLFAAISYNLAAANSRVPQQCRPAQRSLRPGAKRGVYPPLFRSRL
jgi:ATP-dependent helicase HrpA